MSDVVQLLLLFLVVLSVMMTAVFRRRGARPATATGELSNGRDAVRHREAHAATSLNAVLRLFHIKMQHSRRCCYGNEQSPWEDITTIVYIVALPCLVGSAFKAIIKAIRYDVIMAAIELWWHCAHRSSVQTSFPRVNNVNDDNNNNMATLSMHASSTCTITSYS